MKPAASLLLSLTLGALALMQGACSGSPAPIPRQRAYPRPLIYPAAYHRVDLPFGPAGIAVNDSAIVTTPAPGWIDIRYPAYGITVNCTLTAVSPATLRQTLDNRTERIARNLGQARAEALELNSGRLIVAPGALRTPVQFIATDSASYVLSGAAVTDFPPTADPDSVAPLIDAVATDLTFLLRNL